MSVDITKDTIAQTVPEYIADVLRNNLTDKQSPARSSSEWILVNHEDEAHIKGNLPRVYIDYAGGSREAKAPNVIGPVTVLIDIEIWCSGSNAKTHRNQLADEITQYLTDQDSSDGSKTFREQSLMFENCNGSNEDTIIDDVLVRIHKISFQFRYYGH